MLFKAALSAAFLIPVFAGSPWAADFAVSAPQIILSRIDEAQRVTLRGNMPA